MRNHRVLARAETGHRYHVFGWRDGPAALVSIPMIALLDATGFVAALLTTFAFLPQVVQTWRSRSTAGLNLPTLVALTAGIVLWLVYGFGTGQLPVILANAVTLLLVAVLLTLKVRDVRRVLPQRGR